MEKQTGQDLLKALNIKDDEYNDVISMIQLGELKQVDDLVLRCVALEIFMVINDINVATYNMTVIVPQIFTTELVKPISNLLLVTLYNCDALMIKCNKDAKECVMAYYEWLKHVINKIPNQDRKIKTLYTIMYAIYDLEDAVSQFMPDDNDEMFETINDENATIH